ncbi:site-specific integrase [Dysgonomonas sp. BGC7]|uniref:site-specific integrase n=1 Tax=Dysgonomonas sp. BGC7 TaxID=1658008 RepID=UPI000681464E|nr:site-specific integrase [Dysgonomonas sp. BGC7]MBD8388857.1 site-specific integrase [Dysgonomonas sp. BGC7]
MRSTFSISFFVKKSKEKKNGKSPIVCRITINGDKVELATQLDIEAPKWSVPSNRAIGRSNDVKFINETLDSIRMSLHIAYRDLHEHGDIITADSVKNTYLQIGRFPQTLLELFKKHNEDQFELIGRGKSESTYKKYDLSYRRLKEFLKYKYGKEDIFLDHLTLGFVNDYEVYLRTKCYLGHNTTFKMIQYLKRIVSYARNLGLIRKDPFFQHKIKWKHSDPKYLTHFELESIINKEITIKRLAVVRDIFVFSCFCGLSYIDTLNLTQDNIEKHDDRYWIVTRRIKTDNDVRIPLFTIPRKMIDKYANENGIKLLPVMSNQKMNSYLKELADICGIRKNLTYHIQRHSKAHYYLLINRLRSV